MPEENNTKAREENPSAEAQSRQLESLLAQLGETVSRIETSTLDESERKNLETARGLAETAKERDRLKGESREWERRYKDSLARQLLTEAAAAAGAYRAEQVVALLSGNIAWSEDGRDPILSLPTKDGRPLVYDRTRFMEGVKAYLAENPNLAASLGAGGAGSRPSPPSAGPKASFGNGLTLADLKRMRPQLEEMARQARRR